MGLDVGDRNIGVAVSDALLMTAQGRPTLKRSNLQTDLEYLRRVAEENEVTKVVVGKPLHMDGRESPQSRSICDEIIQNFRPSGYLVGRAANEFCGRTTP